MEEKLEIFKKNIISWYPINKNDSVLQIGSNEIITEELNRKTKKVLVLDNIHDVIMETKFDYVTLIGTFENAKSKEEIIELIAYAKSCLNRDGKLLVAMNNKFGMKYWAGQVNANNENPYTFVQDESNNQVGYKAIKEILDGMKLKYKFYYPLPEYNITNVIFTDDFMPTKESIDARDLTFCKYNEFLQFSERKAFAQILENDKANFPFFANSYFIEISEKDKFEDIRFVSFGVTRKEEYRIRTIITKNKVYKVADNDKSNSHIEKVKNNLKILNDRKIEHLGKEAKGQIESEFLKDAQSLDEFLMDRYKEKGLYVLLQDISIFKNRILSNLETLNIVPENNVFTKYDVFVPDNVLNKFTFVKHGMLDLIFQNCLVKKDRLYAYDQEWYEENVPVEFIIYRALIYFTELRKNENINEILEKFEIKQYEKYFEQLETKLQENIVDQDIWKMHENSVKNIGMIQAVIEDYEKSKKHIKQLEDNIQEYQKGIDDLTKLIQDKDVQLVNYANELRSISSSLSWKLTKPVRMLAWLLNPRSGASFIDRIMPPGGKRRIEYDKKQTEKKYKRKVNNYFKLTDEETAEYWKGIDHRLNKKLENDSKKEDEEISDYEKWISANKPTDQMIEKESKTRFKKRPKISIVIPLYNTDTDFFRELLYTVHCQTYSNWELCLADGSEKELSEIKLMCEKDKRIKYKFLGENKGISENTNAAIKMATGNYIALLDHDDMLSIDALYEVVKVINENEGVEFIYSDEDKFHFIDEPRYAPHFKPDYAIDTLRSNNYICHFSVFKKELLDRIGGFNSEYNGAQDFDIILRATENANKIVHISKVLYHWRVHQNSTAMSQEAKPYAVLAGKKAIEAHLKRVGLEGEVFEGKNIGTYGINYKVIGNPKVTILIPNKDELNTLKTCIDSIINKTTYKNYEIVIIENNSESKEIFDYYKDLIKNQKIRVLNYNENYEILENENKKVEFESNGNAFNYSKIINFGVKNTIGDFVVQLNNDTKIITSDWLEKMIGFAQREDVGAVGVKLYYPDETIQHAGIIVGAFQVAAHVFKGLAKDEQGYFGRENLIQNMNAVTAACIMTKREIYEQVGYMNEEFAVAFNDIDFCLKIRKLGKLIVYNPYVELTHYESKTRGDDNAPDKIKRFQGEINLFLNTWKEKLEQKDEYYNINLRLDSDKYDVRTDKVQ